MIDFEPLSIPGCYLISPPHVSDSRGWFLKTMHLTTFREKGLAIDWREDFVSCSTKGVIRGMHFQRPPADHIKLVACLSGSIVDVLLDLRRDSPTYGNHVSVSLSETSGKLVYIASGVAHGFLSLSDRSIVYYKVTSEHSPSLDAGIAWDSFGYEWPISEPILSDRDQSHPLLADFDTPFVWNADD